MFVFHSSADYRFCAEWQAHLDAAHGFEQAQWMVYFTNWSFCLILLSATLGVAVSLRYLILSYHIKHTVVHGRPGLTPQHRASQHSYACFGRGHTTWHKDDLEHGLMLPDVIEPSAAQTDDNDVHVEWAMQGPRPYKNAFRS